MARNYFEEVQHMRDNRWIWFLLLPFSLLMMAPLFYGLFHQLIKREPWGNEPMSDAGLIGITILTGALIALIFTLLYNLTLEVMIDADGIHYRFPFRLKWKQLRPEDIVEYEVRKRKSIFETGGLGYHHNRLARIRAMSVSGAMFMVFRTHNGYRIMIGTQDPEAAMRAIKKVMTKEDNL